MAIEITEQMTYKMTQVMWYVSWIVLLLFALSACAMGATVVVPAGSSASQTQTIVNGAAPGSVVQFAAGSYAGPVNLPCSGGTVYTGPNVGVVTVGNPATAVFSSPAADYALTVESNGSSFLSGQGCTLEFLRFTGTQGGVFVAYPSSGVTLQFNTFDSNNPPQGGANTNANIYVDGQNGGFSAATGAQYIWISQNVFSNNCAAIRAVAGTDSGGYCAATWVNGYNNHLTWWNNTVNGTEQGLKLVEQSSNGVSSLNADVENNNLQGNSRIMIESQQDTNGNGIYAHNAFYQPFNPGNFTFALSLPEFTASVSPTHVVTDNAFINGVAITGESGSGAHIGIGLELWGAGSSATYNLFQGGNGADSCGAGSSCTGWPLVIGQAFTNATIANNYFSGFDEWNGPGNDLTKAVTYEDGATSGNAGLTFANNTVVQTSTTVPVTAPVIAPATGSVTITDSDSNRRLSIFYTTDGSNPAAFPPGGAAGTSQLYAGAFTPSSGAIVKAIAAWGQGANQGIVFPQFGYVPSAVVSAVYAPQGPVTAQSNLVSVYVNTSAGYTLKVGATMQLSLFGVYSNPTTTAVANSQINRHVQPTGITVIGTYNATSHVLLPTGVVWSSSNPAVLSINQSGLVTAIAPGVATVQGSFGVVGNVATITVK